MHITAIVRILKYRTKRLGNGNFSRGAGRRKSLMAISTLLHRYGEDERGNLWIVFPGHTVQVGETDLASSNLANHGAFSSHFSNLICDPRIWEPRNRKPFPPLGATIDSGSLCGSTSWPMLLCCICAFPRSANRMPRAFPCSQARQAQRVGMIGVAPRSGSPDGLRSERSDLPSLSPGLAPNVPAARSKGEDVRIGGVTHGYFSVGFQWPQELPGKASDREAYTLNTGCFSRAVRSIVWVAPWHGRGRRGFPLLLPLTN